MTDFSKMNKADLEEAARYLHVYHDANATKAEIIAAIYDSGQDEDSYDKRFAVEPEDNQIDEVVGNVEVEEEPEEAEEEPKNNDVVYGRFLGRNLAFITAEGHFGRTKPVFKTDAETLKTLATKYPGKFREANAKEAGLA